MTSVRAKDFSLTIVLCLLAAALEGVDLQSMGIAAPKLIPELGLSKAQFGTAASMSPGGLLIGAVIGGRVSDRFGRKRVLVAALVLLGLSSLLTTLVHDYPTLLLVRAIVGLGLGGAFPMLIAIASESVPPGRSAFAISLMYAGVPMGTIIGTLMTLYAGDAFQWRWIFYLGGCGPLVIAPIMYWLLPEGRVVPRPAAARGEPGGLEPIGAILFGENRAASTVLLWTAFFFTLIIIYLLTNWLNQLMTQRGFSHAQSTTVLLGFGIGSVAGSISLGAVMAAGFRRFSALVTYSGLALCLAGLALLNSYPLLVLASAGTGFFAVGAQLVNYALAPRLYRDAIRGTGVGWAVAVGRLGSFSGPLVGGLLLGSGMAASTVLLAFLPGLLIASCASSALLWRDTAKATG